MTRTTTTNIMASNLFDNAQNSTVNIGEVITAKKYIRHEASLTNPLKELVPWIAPEAMHDSDARSDAPKCHENTRVAVQDEIHSWVIHGDSDQEPKKIKWITGPAGTGKTAIARSLAERFDKEGLLAATFFFSSFSPYPGQGTQRTWIPTIAYQLAQQNEGFKRSLAYAIEENPLVFKKNLQVQMDELVLGPLRHSAGQSKGASSWRKVIIVDGLDECDVDQVPESNIPTPGKRKSKRTKDEDQLEILQALLRASVDPDFPFHVIIASRPERVFRAFFKPDDVSAPFATILTLNEKYNPDDDIDLYLNAKFAEIKRKYNIPASWPPSGAIRKLVKNASGQFIYAATLIEFIIAPSTRSPQVVLDIILEIRPTPEAGAENPFAHLDALYTHILQSSPNPTLAVKWLLTIEERAFHLPASFINQWLQDDAGESERLLGPLHSLIQVPPRNDSKALYTFYHKSLFDFLNYRHRAVALWVDPDDRYDFYLHKYWNVLLQRDAYSESFLDHFLDLRPPLRPYPGSQPIINRWIELCVSSVKYVNIYGAFLNVHEDCYWYRRCHSSCRKWRSSIIRECNKANWGGVPPRWLSPFLTRDKWLWNIAVPNGSPRLQICPPLYTQRSISSGAED